MSLEWYKLLDKSNYFDEVLACIDKSQRSVSIVVFEYFYAVGGQRNPVNFLTYALQRAKTRGVKVRVVINQKYRVKDLVEKVHTTKSYLERAGIEVKFAPKSTCLHAKFLVIDEKILIVGSHNWSVFGVKKNEEISLAIKEVGVVSLFADKFNSYWETY